MNGKIMNGDVVDAPEKFHPTCKCPADCVCSHCVEEWANQF